MGRQRREKINPFQERGGGKKGRERKRKKEKED
jgi:hypothetical protein